MSQPDWNGITTAGQAALQEQGQKAVKLPLGRHWTKLTEARGFIADDGTPYVALTFSEANVETPRQYVHYEQYRESTGRMKHVNKLLAALGASEKVISDPPNSFRWLSHAHKQCFGSEFMIKLTERRSSRGVIFTNLKIMGEKDAEMTDDPIKDENPGYESWNPSSDQSNTEEPSF